MYWKQKREKKRKTGTIVKLMTLKFLHCFHCYDDDDDCDIFLHLCLFYGKTDGHGKIIHFFSLTTGMDAQVAYGFHHLRNEKPYLAQGPLSNKVSGTLLCLVKRFNSIIRIMYVKLNFSGFSYKIFELFFQPINYFLKLLSTGNRSLFLRMLKSPIVCLSDISHVLATFSAFK